MLAGEGMNGKGGWLLFSTRNRAHSARAGLGWGGIGFESTLLYLMFLLGIGKASRMQLVHLIFQ